MNECAFVCDHVAVDGDPILCAARSEPIDPADSGWQFLCGRDGHSKNVKIWALHEVVAREPSLAKYIGLPYGLELNRKSVDDDWIISCFEESEQQSDGYWRITKQAVVLALCRLYNHRNMQVRLNAAKETLAVAAKKARATLEAIAGSKWYPQAGNAGMSLWNLDRGVFKPT